MFLPLAPRLVSRVLMAIVLGLLLVPCLCRGADEPRPNVVLIMLDDFGYECVGANGGTSYRTPVLDRLAAQGLRFEHCYVQPLCTPTRVQLMTGLYNVRNYLQFGEMDPTATTFGNLFQKAGYATCIAGKWQLGQDADLPRRFGFDEHYLWQHTRRPERYKNPGLEINGEPKDWSNGEYGPDLINAHALDFVTRHKEAPFFLYYPMILTHSPYVPTPDSPDYSGKGKAGGKKAARKNGGGNHFKDMVEYADQLIGRIDRKLDELGIRDNTLLIVIGDNGTGREIRSQFHGEPVQGGKGLMTHRGMHVPLIVSWPRHTAARPRVLQDLVDSTDFLPTICEAAGVPVPEKIDGRSFCPQLRGELGQPRPHYYSWYAPRAQFVGEFAADHHFKLYRDGRLFDLRSDPEEASPLGTENRNVAARAAVAKLQPVLDSFRDARPEDLKKRTSLSR